MVSNVILTDLFCHFDEERCLLSKVSPCRPSTVVIVRVLTHVAGISSLVSTRCRRLLLSQLKVHMRTDYDVSHRTKSFFYSSDPVSVTLLRSYSSSDKPPTDNTFITVVYKETKENSTRRDSSVEEVESP